jgi:hypothetical protein
MFESNYTCHFFRLWGYEEGKKGIPLKDALLGNMQNDFDAKFGDVCAEVGSRYFIVEFKRNRAGFKKEISSAGKPHRAYLYQHIRDDRRCYSISRVGHFGAYADSQHQLVFESYAHCPADNMTEAQIWADRLSHAPIPWHAMNYPLRCLDFNDFFQSIANVDSEMSEGNPDFFKKGLGVTKSHLEEYIHCMYQHLESVQDDTGESVIGAFSPSTGKFVAFTGSITELIKRLHQFFAEMKSSQSHGQTSWPTGPCA